MKMIVGYIRPEQVMQVKQELYSREIFALSLTNVLGAGRQKGYASLYRGITTQVNLFKKVRVEVVVPDDKVDAVFEAIRSGAYTGNNGDGVIFAFDVVKGCRIRTNEDLF